MKISCTQGVQGGGDPRFQLLATKSLFLLIIVMKNHKNRHSSRDTNTGNMKTHKNMEKMKDSKHRRNNRHGLLLLVLPPP